MRYPATPEFGAIRFEPLEERLLLSTVIAQTGFNDASGVHANGAAGSPYLLGSPLDGQGAGEPGWARPWRSSGSSSGIQGGAVYEGDGALFIAPSADFLSRRFVNAQHQAFTFEFRIRFNAGASGDIMLWREMVNETQSTQAGPVVNINSNGRINVRDGLVNGMGGTSEFTGFIYAPGQWHHIQIIANPEARTWRFLFDGNEFLAPDPLGFRSDMPVLNAVYFAVSDAYIDDLKITGAPLAPFGPDNVFMVHTDYISEYTLTGELVQQFSLPQPVEALDMEVDLGGRLHILSAQGAERTLLTYTPSTGQAEYHTYPDWFTLGLPGIAATDRYVYAPDISGSGAVIRFSLADLTDVVRIETVLRPSHVTLGLDGFLYILNEDGDAAKYDRDTFNLITQYPLRKFEHGTLVSGIAVDSNGDIFTCDIDNNIYMHDNAGNLIDVNSNDLAQTGLIIRQDGVLVSGSGANLLGVTDRAFASSNQFPLSDGGDANPHYVTFTVPQFTSGLPVVSITALDASAAETTGTPNPGRFRITRTGDTDEDLAVSFTVTGTAANGSDHVLIPSPVIIPAGAAFIDIDVLPIDDSVAELNETVILTLTDAAGYDLGAAQATVTIEDNEPPVVTIEAVDASASEAAGNTGSFRITRGGPTGASLEVAYSVSGTAASGADYAALAGTAVIPIGSAFVDVTLTPINDSISELNETVVVTLDGGAGYSVGDDDSATVTITDNDGSLITIEALDASASESGDTGAFRISRVGSTSAGLNVNILRSGTALLGGDYTQAINGTLFSSNTVFFASGVSSVDIVVTAVDDALFESAETVGITLAPGTGYTLPALAADRFRTVTIADNEQRMASIADVTVTEGNAGTTLATFTVKLSGATTGPVTVDFAAAAGTATEGADFTASAGTITFLAGQTSKTITVPVVGDLIDEDDQTFLVNLLNPSGIGIADGQAVGTIKDNDNGPMISINDVTVSEIGDANVEAVFNLTLSFASERSISVTVATGQAPGAPNTRAVDGADFLALSPTVFTFAPGQTSIPVAVTTLFDDLAELNEKFAVNLTLPVNATIKDKQGLGTINDDDAPSVSIGDAEATEGDTGTTNAAFTVTLSHASTVPVTVKYSTTAGTAIANSDYTTQTNKTVTFAPGETSKVVNVPVKSDKRDEPAETFTVNLISAVNATLGDAQGAGTIVDNDPTPALSVNDVTTAEGDAGTKLVTFTVKLSAASGQTVTVDYSAVDDTAEEGSDFAAAAGTLTFLPGITSQKVTVTVNGDTEAENNETFKLQLSNAVNAIFDDAEGLATITSEETAPASMNNYLLAGIVTSGKAPLATTGTFTFAVSADGAGYTITGDGGAVGDSGGTMTYTRTGKKTGRIDFIDAVRGAGVMLLTFAGTHSMAYTMTLAGGNQKGTMAGV